MTAFEKDPAAVLDFAWDWSQWLGSDTISSQSVSGDGLTVGTVTQGSGVVTAWLSGGTEGQEYEVTCKIVTAGGRTDERSILIYCRNR